MVAKTASIVNDRHHKHRHRLIHLLQLWSNLLLIYDDHNVVFSLHYVQATNWQQQKFQANQCNMQMWWCNAGRITQWSTSWASLEATWCGWAWAPNLYQVGARSPVMNKLSSCCGSLTLTEDIWMESTWVTVSPLSTYRNWLMKFLGIIVPTISRNLGRSWE
jgi:hypothetical protein